MFPGAFTESGTRLDGLSRFPSRPWPSYPQQYTLPFDPTAQVCWYAALTPDRVTPAGSVLTSTGTGVERLASEPSPSRPLPLWPQQ